MLSRSLRCLLPGDGRAGAARDIALDNPYLRGVPIGCPSVMAVPRLTEGRHEGGELVQTVRAVPWIAAKLGRVSNEAHRTSSHGGSWHGAPAHRSHSPRP